MSLEELSQAFADAKYRRDLAIYEYHEIARELRARGLLR